MVTRRVTSLDVAKAAGVSRTTVSLVLNEVRGIQISEGTRHRVIEAAQELGYVPNAAARALVSSRAQIVGLVLTRSTHHIASDSFLTQILDGLIESVRAQGMRLLIDIIEPEHQKEAYLQLVRSKHIDGMILSGPRVDDEALQALTDDGFPTVLMGQVPGKNFYCVDVDNFTASHVAVSHLVKLGHKRIACITNAPLTYTAAAERLRGYRQALEDAHIPFDETLVRFGDFSLSSGYKQMYHLFDAGAWFTAAFVASDEVAMGASAAVRDHGMSIPKDMALVGFDDLPLAYYMDPPLTTVHLPAIDLARHAIDMLIQILKGKHLAKKQRILDTYLVVRQSCGSQPNHGLAPAR
jgi:LacI family transcriptional regulator